MLSPTLQSEAEECTSSELSGLSSPLTWNSSPRDQSSSAAARSSPLLPDDMTDLLHLDLDLELTSELSIDDLIHSDALSDALSDTPTFALEVPLPSSNAVKDTSPGEPYPLRHKRASSSRDIFEPREKKTKSSNKKGSRDPNRNARLAKENRERKKQYVQGLETQVDNLKAQLAEQQAAFENIKQELDHERVKISQLQQALEHAPVLSRVISSLTSSPGLKFAPPDASGQATTLPIQLNLQICPV